MSGLLAFFNEYFNFKHIAQEKRKFRQQEARVEALPEDYRYVYRQIQHYMWGYSRGSGMDMLPIFADLLDLFETGAAEGKRVLDVTGEDVATFCDELLRTAKTYTGKHREALNQHIGKKLGKRHGAERNYADAE
jgi:DNA-binding ferritin-like protein (Dps family)